MTIKWCCSENGQSELGISPNYLRNSVLFMLNEQGGYSSLCELDLDTVDEVIEMLQMLSKKIDDNESKKLH
jgi:hypothetical protein